MGAHSPPHPISKCTLHRKTEKPWRNCKGRDRLFSHGLSGHSPVLSPRASSPTPVHPPPCAPFAHPTLPMDPQLPITQIHHWCVFTRGDRKRSSVSPMGRVGNQLAMGIMTRICKNISFIWVKTVGQG